MATATGTGMKDGHSYVLGCPMTSDSNNQLNTGPTVATGWLATTLLYFTSTAFLFRSSCRSDCARNTSDVRNIARCCTSDRFDDECSEETSSYTTHIPQTICSHFLQRAASKHTHSCQPPTWRNKRSYTSLITFAAH